VNALDIGVVAALAVCGAVGAARGLMRTLFSFMSLAVALALARHIYPFVLALLRGTDFIFGAVKGFVAGHVGGIVPEDTAKAAQAAYVAAMDVPAFLKGALIGNNNPEVYGALGAADFADYVYGFLANVIIGAAALVVTFIAVAAIIWAIARALDIAGRLPVVKQFNTAGGLLLGLAVGAGILVVAAAATSVFIYREDWAAYRALADGSLSGAVLYDNNPIIQALTEMR
jgi:uncharacterized membrane protein required for colicin V production